LTFLQGGFIYLYIYYICSSCSYLEKNNKKKLKKIINHWIMNLKWNPLWFLFRVKLFLKYFLFKNILKKKFKKLFLYQYIKTIQKHIKNNLKLKTIKNMI
jgi:hypothetical protein